MKVYLILAVVLVTACGGKEDSGEQVPATVAQESCLQVQVRVGEGFMVDGHSEPADRVGAALAAALGKGDRTPVVDVACDDGVTMGAIRELHEAMGAEGLRRIQYFGDLGSPVPYLLPDAEMLVRLDELPADDRWVVALRHGAGARVGTEEFSREAVVEQLARNPGTVVVLDVDDDVAYEQFVHVMSAITDAGARRVMVRIG